jgi:Mce-associated membrane protein
MSTTTERPTDPHAAAGPLRKTPRPAASSVEPDDDAERPPPPPSGDPTAPVRPPRLPWILAILGLVGTLAFGLAWLNARDGGSGATHSSDRTAVLLMAAMSFSKDPTHFDGATIDRDFDRITARATGDFRSQADQFFSSDVRSQLKKAQASSRGEVRSAYVQTVDGDRGTVFVVVDQTIANKASPQPQADTLRMELGLVQRDGTWKVERVSVLTAPSGGATGAATEQPSDGGSGGN